MSFDLFVLFKKPDETTQRKWVDELKIIGIECQFPDDFLVGFDSHAKLQCKLNPPLVKESTGLEDYEFNLESVNIDKEYLSELVASSNDLEVKQKLVNMTKEIQFYSSSGRDDCAHIVQCFAAAALAHVTDGILFDPQEFGATHKEKVYQVATRHCEYEIKSINDTNKKETKISHNSNTNISNRNNDNLFNPNAISVAKDWENAKYSDLYTGAVEMSFSCSEKGINSIEKNKIEKYSPNRVKTPLIFNLTLLQYNQGIKYSRYYRDATMVLGEKMFEAIPLIDEKNKGNHWKLAYIAKDYLETYVSLACAESVLTPCLPDKELLLKGVKQYDERLIKIKGKFEFTEIDGSVLAVVALLLIEENDLALVFLERCQGSREMTKHRKILTSVVNELIKNKKNIIVDPKVESDFFELFNGYRLISNQLTKDYNNNEHPIIVNPIGNYLFAWLYLKLFKGQETSTWEEMRIIMMS